MHALILCETWLTPETKNLIKFGNFTYSGIERKEKKGGGVGFLIKNNLIFRERTDLTNTGCFIWNIILLRSNVDVKTFC